MGIIICGAGRNVEISKTESSSDTGHYSSVTVCSADGVLPYRYPQLTSTDIIEKCRRCLDRGVVNRAKIEEMNCDISIYNYNQVPEVRS